MMRRVVVGCSLLAAVLCCLLLPFTSRAADTDGDGIDDAIDCRPADARFWAVPEEAPGLVLAGSRTTSLTWSPPPVPGGTVLRYDVLRSTDPGAFGTAACVATNLSSLTTIDDATAAPVLFYLVRSKNDCGSTLGRSSSGAPRSGSDCSGQRGQSCAFDRECAAGACTDAVCCESVCGGPCEACNQPGRLGYCDPVPAGQDPANECATDPVASCGDSGSCSGSRSCALYAAGTVCIAASCASSSSANREDTCNGSGSCVDNGVLNCAPYVCQASTGTCKTSCAVNTDCVSGYTCSGGACRKSQGSVCAFDADCSSGFCRDGNCCESACSGLCEACNQPGRAGYCDAVPNGQDPSNECATDPVSSCLKTGSCSGARSCSLYSSGTVCAASSCATSTSANRADTCNGTGSCLDNGVADCTPYICSSASGACKTSCTVNSDCASGYACSGGACRKSQGSVCAFDADCSTGFCRDGVCCQSSCTGVCESCNLSGRAGFCDAVPNGADPDNECATDPAASCGKTGACSGSRSCSLYTSGTVCSPASCASSTSANRADTCNGSGTCVDNGVQNCIPYTCNGLSGNCRTNCASSADCAAGYTCLAGACQ